MNHRLVCSAAALLMGLTGCGSDLPSRSEFVNNNSANNSWELSKLVESSKIDAKAFDKVYQDFLGCLYDSVTKDDLRDLADDATRATFDRVVTSVPAATACRDALVKGITTMSAG